MVGAVQRDRAVGRNVRLVGEDGPADVCLGAAARDGVQVARAAVEDPRDAEDARKEAEKRVEDEKEQKEEAERQAREKQVSKEAEELVQKKAEEEQQEHQL